MLSASVFVSHAAADESLARSFVDLLVDGIGVPHQEVFCSSLPDFGIPTGQNFVEYMRDQIDQSLIVILLMSPSYMVRPFCQAEMGAAWVRAKAVFPIVVPPTSFNDVNGVMLGKQAAMITEEVGFTELRERLVDLLEFEPIKLVRWEMKRRQFFKALPGLLENLAKPSIIQAAIHDELVAKYDDALAELEAQDTKVRQLEAKIVELRKVKDAAGVAKVSAQFTDTMIGDAFERSVNTAKRAISAIGGGAVRRLYLAKRYGKPFDVQDFDRSQFDAAIRRNVLTSDCEPYYDQRDVAAAERALEAVESLIRDKRVELEEYCEANCSSPLEVENEDFWNEHLL